MGEKSIKIHFFTLFAINVCFNASFSLFNYTSLVLVPFGVDEFVSGLIVGIPRFLTFPLCIVYFFFAKKINYRSQLLFLAVFSIVHYFILAQASYLWVYILLAFSQGYIISAATSFPLTLVSQILEPKNRASQLALFGISGNASQAISYLLGDLLNRFFGVSSIFYGGVVLSVIAFCILFIWNKKYPVIESLEKLKEKNSQDATVRFWDYAGLVIPGLIVGIAFFTYFSTMPYYAYHELNISNVFLFSLGYTLMIVLIRLLFASWIDVIAPYKFLIFSYSLVVFSYFLAFLLGFVGKSYWLFISIAAVYGLGHAFMFPVTNILFIRRTPKNIPEASLMFLICFNVGSFLGSAIFGVFASWSTYQIAYLLMGGSLFVAGIFSLLLKSNRSILTKIESS